MSENVHLKRVMSQLHDYGDKIPWDFWLLFGGELIFAKMYYPYKDYDYVADEDGYIYVFTSPEEYRECFDESIMESNYFEDPFLFFNEEDSEGIVINPKSDNVKLTIEDIRDIRYDYDVEYGMYNSSKVLPKHVKKLKKTKNPQLNRFIEDEGSDLDELLKIILDSKVFVLVEFDGDTIKGGVVKREKYGYYTDGDGYVCIYSSWDEVLKSKHENVYATVPIHEYYITYVLFNDFEGVKLNDNIVLSREFLIRNIVKIVHALHENPMRNYSRYGLKIK